MRGIEALVPPTPLIKQILENAAKIAEEATKDVKGIMSPLEK